MANKAKKIAVNAELRKESKSFNGWFKYEIDIKNEDGTITKVPAYGKDLQDALSRVVHDDQVKKFSFVLEKVPSFVWILIWFVTMGAITSYYTNHATEIGDAVGLLYIATVSVLTTITISINNWFKLRNKDKK